MPHEPSRKPPILGRCPTCNGRMDMSDVGQSMAPYKGGPVTFHWMCSNCAQNGTVTVSWDRASRLSNQWFDWLAKAQKSYDTELVGKQVQGFRIDLDVVSTPADITAIWDEQRQRAPHTIPRGSHV